MPRRVGRVLAFIMIAVLAGACALGEILADYGEPVDLTPADVIGTWQSGGIRFITFAEDGSFLAKNLPPALFDDLQSPDASSDVDGAGTWELAQAGTKSDGPHSTVALTFTAGAPRAMSGHDLSALRQDNDAVFLFFFYISAGGNSWTSYQKCGQECPQ